MKYDDRQMFRLLRKALKDNGLPYWGVLPRLAERWGRRVRTIYSYSNGDYPLPPDLWDDLRGILTVLGVEVGEHVTKHWRPEENPGQFVARLRRGKQEHFLFSDNESRQGGVPKT